jgi:hypothetical protein
MIDEEKRGTETWGNVFLVVFWMLSQPWDLSSIYTWEITSIEAHDVGETLINLQKTAVKLMIFAP